MGIYDFIFKKRNKKVVEEQIETEETKSPEFIKSDIVIFMEHMNEPVIRDDQVYCLIGYYNKDKTRFKDLLTNTIHNVDFHENIRSTYFNGIPYTMVSNITGVKETDGGFKKNYIAQVPAGKVPLLNNATIFLKKPNGKVCSMPLFEATAEYFQTPANEPVSLDLINNMANELNRYAHNQVKKASEHSSKVAKIQETYSKDF